MTTCVRSQKRPVRRYRTSTIAQHERAGSEHPRRDSEPERRRDEHDEQQGAGEDEPRGAKRPHGVSIGRLGGAQ
jgi:hypothetical protein